MQVLVILTDDKTTTTESDKKDAEEHAHALSQSSVKLIAVLIGPHAHPQDMDKILQNAEDEIIKSSGLESPKELGRKIVESKLIHLCERTYRFLITIYLFANR